MTTAIVTGFYICGRSAECKKNLQVLSRVVGC